MTRLADDPGGVRAVGADEAGDINAESALLIALVRVAGPCPVGADERRPWRPRPAAQRLIRVSPDRERIAGQRIGSVEGLPFKRGSRRLPCPGS